jgi:imidazolonepropionase-like amidohydrolase
MPAMHRWIRWVAALVAIGIALYLILWLWPLHDPHPEPKLAQGTLVIQNAKIYPSPDDPPLESATLLVQDGKIVALGSNVPIPKGAQVVACQPCIVTAGYWNAHVHFTEPKWSFAAWKSASTLNEQLADMLTSRGFTTVVDVGSNPRDTVSLRRRIAHGDLKGPQIYTAGAALYPPNGLPFYLRDNLPFYARWFIPQPETPEDAAAAARRSIEQGSDVLKLFTGAYLEPDKVLPMPDNIAAAAAEVAHANRQLVIAHPSDLAGTMAAVRSGVDILAHAPDSTEGIDDSVIRAVLDHNMAMVPTLKMFGTTVTKQDAYLQPIYSIVRRFHEAGGQVIFGTDVGYMTDYRTEDEFVALQQSGLDAMEILRALTTAPAERFGVSHQRGTIEPGQMADLVVLSEDPAQNVTAFARVAVTIRNGEIIYQRP